MDEITNRPAAAIKGEDHWTTKDGNVKLFLFEKCAGDPKNTTGTILFVHGSSMAAQPTFDLQVEGRPIPRRWTGSRAAASTAGPSTWKATAARPRIATTTRRSRKAPTIALPPQAISRSCAASGRSWFTAFRPARCAPLYSRERHPDLVGRLALDAMVWTGEGSPTLAERKKKLPEFRAKNRRPIDKAFIHSIFDRDHPGTAEEKVIDAFADAVIALDTSVPTGTYVDMCSNLPVVDPEKITVPTLIMRGQWDGIAGFDDLVSVLRQAAEPRQALCRHARHFACELPAEELRAGLSHPVELLHPAGADLSGLRSAVSGPSIDRSEYARKSR